ncbi:MAG: Ldh family oxidoreductase [Lachnospiraceae bacterium]
MKVKPETYQQLIQTICRKAGLDEEDARATAGILVRNDMLGVQTHGTYQLLTYIHKIKAGGIDPHAKPEVTAEGPAYARIDAKHAIGPVGGMAGIRKAIEIARKCGVSYVGVYNGSHYGTNTAYALEAVKENMGVLVMSNTIKLMAAPGSKGPVIGNSPFCFAFPAGKHRAAFFDIATSTAAYTRILRARDDGEKLPDGWIVDGNGRPTNDPHAEAFSLVPFGGHKGYGIAFLIEAMTGILSGGAILGEVEQDGNRNLPNPYCVSHAFVVFDVSSILGRERFGERMDQAIDEIHDSPKASGSSRIMVPGEIEMDKYKEAEKNGLVLADDIVERVGKLCAEYELDIQSAAYVP